MNHFQRIGRVAAFLATLGGVSSAAHAQDQRMITDAEAPVWQAVGRLNVAGNRGCTATLISPDEAITAAHCLFHPVTRHRADPGDIRFVAGFRRDSFAALLGVSAVAVMPGYTYDGPELKRGSPSIDLALLKLDQSVAADKVQPFAVVDWPEGATGFDIIGYGRDRPLIAAIREECRLQSQVGEAKLLDCAVVAGLSGAPVVISGSQTVVGVVSASVGTRVKGTQVLVTPLAPYLADLRALIAK